MQLLAKIFIILGIVLGFWMIVPLVIGLISLGKINKGEDLVLWGILSIIFVSPLGGIFMLLCPKKA